MSLSKKDMVYRLYAITRSKVEGLDKDTSDAIATEVDRFSSGKDSRLKSEELSDMLDKLAEAVGPEVADMRVEHRKKVDEIYRTDPKPLHSDPIDFTKQFGKAAVRTYLAENGIKTTTKTKVSDLQAKVVEHKQDSWEDDAPHAEAAERQSQIDAAEAKRKEDEERARIEAEGNSRSSGKPAASKALTISEPVAIQVGAKGKACNGLLHPDASVSFNDDCADAKSLGIAGKTYRSTSKAACAAMQSKAANGWLRITYLDGETRRPIDALRENSKGYSLSTGSRRSRKQLTPEDAAQEVTRLEARVRRLTSSLEKAKADLAAAKQVADAQPEDEPEGECDRPDEDPAEEERAEDAAMVEAEAESNREEELRSMKAKQLREIAAGLKIKGRSKLKVNDLVSAILAAEAA